MGENADPWILWNARDEDDSWAFYASDYANAASFVRGWLESEWQELPERVASHDECKVAVKFLPRDLYVAGHRDGHLVELCCAAGRPCPRCGNCEI